jgi:hypothetical protein
MPSLKDRISEAHRSVEAVCAPGTFYLLAFETEQMRRAWVRENGDFLCNALMARGRQEGRIWEFPGNSKVILAVVKTPSDAHKLRGLIFDECDWFGRIPAHLREALEHQLRQPTKDKGTE